MEATHTNLQSADNFIVDATAEFEKKNRWPAASRWAR